MPAPRRAALVLLAGCGRLGFHAEPAPGPVDALAVDAPVDARAADAPPDAPVDALAELVVSVDPGPRHVGDTSGGVPQTPQVSPVVSPFTMAVTCSSATLELDFIGPYGPNESDEPTLTVNGSDLGSVFQFFPPFTDPGWNGGDYAGPDGSGVFTIPVVLPCTPLLGSNTFAFTTHNPTDDVFYDDVIVRCEHPH